MKCVDTFSIIMGLVETNISKFCRGVYKNVLKNFDGSLSGITGLL